MKNGKSKRLGNGNSKVQQRQKPRTNQMTFEEVMGRIARVKPDKTKTKR